MGRQDLIRIEQLRQENERLQEKIAEYQRKELEDIRAYAQLSAENISLRQQQSQPRAAAAAAASAMANVAKDNNAEGVTNAGVAAAPVVTEDRDKQNDRDDNHDVDIVDKTSWEVARLQQQVHVMEHEKQTLTAQIRRYKRQVNQEREKRLRLERIMISAGMDLEQIMSDDEDNDDNDDENNRKLASLSLLRKSKPYKGKKRGQGGEERLRYPCPAQGCSYVMAVNNTHDAPLEAATGDISDKRPWPLSMRNNALRMRKHMEEFHPDFPRQNYPPGFIKKFSYTQPQSKRPRVVAPHHHHHHHHSPDVSPPPPLPPDNITTNTNNDNPQHHHGRGGTEVHGEYAMGNTV